MKVKRLGRQGEYERRDKESHEGVALHFRSRWIELRGFMHPYESRTSRRVQSAKLSLLMEQEIL